MSKILITISITLTLACQGGCGGSINLNSTPEQAYNITVSSAAAAKFLSYLIDPANAPAFWIELNDWVKKGLGLLDSDKNIDLSEWLEEIPENQSLSLFINSIKNVLIKSGLFDNKKPIGQVLDIIKSVLNGIIDGTSSRLMPAQSYYLSNQQEKKIVLENQLKNYKNWVDKL